MQSFHLRLGRIRRSALLRLSCFVVGLALLGDAGCVKSGGTKTEAASTPNTKAWAAGIADQMSEAAAHETDIAETYAYIESIGNPAVSDEELAAFVTAHHTPQPVVSADKKENPAVSDEELAALAPVMAVDAPQPGASADKKENQAVKAIMFIPRKVGKLMKKMRKKKKNGATDTDADDGNVHLPEDAEEIAVLDGAVSAQGTADDNASAGQTLLAPWSNSPSIESLQQQPMENGGRNSANTAPNEDHGEELSENGFSAHDDEQLDPLDNTAGNSGNTLPNEDHVEELSENDSSSHYDEQWQRVDNSARNSANIEQNEDHGEELPEDDSSVLLAADGKASAGQALQAPIPSLEEYCENKPIESLQQRVDNSARNSADIEQNEDHGEEQSENGFSSHDNRQPGISLFPPITDAATMQAGGVGQSNANNSEPDMESSTDVATVAGSSTSTRAEESNLAAVGDTDKVHTENSDAANNASSLVALQEDVNTLKPNAADKLVQKSTPKPEKQKVEMLDKATLTDPSRDTASTTGKKSSRNVTTNTSRNANLPMRENGPAASGDANQTVANNSNDSNVKKTDEKVNDNSLNTSENVSKTTQKHDRDGPKQGNPDKVAKSEYVKVVSSNLTELNVADEAANEKETLNKPTQEGKKVVGSHTTGAGDEATRESAVSVIAGEEEAVVKSVVPSNKSAADQEKAEDTQELENDDTEEDDEVNENEGKGRNVGLIVAIIVLAAIFCSGGAVLAFFLIRRHRRSKKSGMPSMVAGKECVWEYKPGGYDSDV